MNELNIPKDIQCDLSIEELESNYSFDGQQYFNDYCQFSFDVISKLQFYSEQINLLEFRKFLRYSSNPKNHNILSIFPLYYIAFTNPDLSEYKRFLTAVQNGTAKISEKFTSFLLSNEVFQNYFLNVTFPAVFGHFCGAEYLNLALKFLQSNSTSSFLPQLVGVFLRHNFHLRSSFSMQFLKTFDNPPYIIDLVRSSLVSSFYETSYLLLPQQREALKLLQSDQKAYDSAIFDYFLLPILRSWSSLPILAASFIASSETIPQVHETKSIFKRSSSINPDFQILKSNIIEMLNFVRKEPVLKQVLYNAFKNTEVFEVPELKSGLFSGSVPVLLSKLDLQMISSFNTGSPITFNPLSFITLYLNLVQCSSSEAISNTNLSHIDVLKQSWAIHREIWNRSYPIYLLDNDRKAAKALFKSYLFDLSDNFIINTLPQNSTINKDRVESKKKHESFSNPDFVGDFIHQQYSSYGSLRLTEILESSFTSNKEKKWLSKTLPGLIQFLQTCIHSDGDLIFYLKTCVTNCFKDANAYFKDKLNEYDESKIPSFFPDIHKGEISSSPIHNDYLLFEKSMKMLTYAFIIARIRVFDDKWDLLDFKTRGQEIFRFQETNSISAELSNFRFYSKGERLGLIKSLILTSMDGLQHYLNNPHENSIVGRAILMYKELFKMLTEGGQAVYASDFKQMIDNSFSTIDPIYRRLFIGFYVKICQILEQISNCDLPYMGSMNGIKNPIDEAFVNEIIDPNNGLGSYMSFHYKKSQP